jgi:hypothetical protein
MGTTKSNLASAQLINLVSGEKVDFMFNPKEYTLTKTNNWELKPAKGKNLPSIEFKQGGAQSLKLQIFFDTYAEGTDVRTHTDKIWKMMAVDESTKNTKSNKSSPPKVAFQWGSFYFKAVIKSISQKYTLFLADGTPVRTTIDITLDQLIDEEDYAPQGGSAPSYREAASAANVDNPSKSSAR